MNERNLIVLGVTGSIAAYKAPDVCRRLLERGAVVSTALTTAGAKFIGPLVFEALTGKPVYLDPVSVMPSFDAKSGIVHTDMTAEADAMIVAPATADIIAKIAHGFADDPVSVCALALPASTPLIIAPAMNPRMWDAAATRENVEKLKRRGVLFVGPEEGLMACGDVGRGRMSEPAKIASHVLRAISRAQATLPPLRILILSGPTREYLDDVRFISNGSSGRFGAALADAAFEAGAEVTVVCGRSEFMPSPWITSITIESAEEMLEAARAIPFDLLISPAAIADYKPLDRAKGKPAKSGSFDLSLTATPDVFSELLGAARRANPHARGIAFAAENSIDEIEKAAEKAKRKGAAAIVLNSAVETMGAETASVRFIETASGKRIDIDKLPKAEAARTIIDLALALP